jgi:hypothetical protein
VEIWDPESVVAEEIVAARVREMLQAGLRSLAQTEDLPTAWQTLIPDFAPSMRIGLKLNCLSSYLTNSLPLLQALVQSLTDDLGADPDRIVAWDRRGDELVRAGITPEAIGAQTLGTVTSIQDDSGPGYETRAECVIDRETHLSRILTEETDITINLPLLKKHTVAGMTGALKNIYGCIDNPGDFHGDLNTSLPVLYRLDPIHSRCRLHITEAVLAVTRGDTADPSDAAPGRLLLSRDPVALDKHALDLMNSLRDPLPPIPAEKVTWIEGAAGLNLGTTSLDLDQITA